jgi:hypothetical protein
MINANIQVIGEPFIEGILRTLKNRGYFKLRIKSNIMIPKSVRLIGVIDEYEVLKEGEVFF